MPRAFPGFALLAVTITILAVAGPAWATVHHRIFGLDPALAYRIMCGAEVISSSAVPGPSGDLMFDAPTGSAITITPVGSSVGVGDGIPNPLQLAGPFPNPSNGAFKVDLTVSSPGPVRAALYGPSGRRVGIIYEGTLGAGQHTLSFESGRGGVPRLASSVYLLKIEAGGREMVRKLLVRR